MRQILKKISAVAKFFAGRTFAVGLLSVVLAAVIFTITTASRTVYIVDGNEASIHHTLQVDPQKILAGAGISTAPYDKVVYTTASPALAEMQVARGFQVTLTVDRRSQTHMVTSGTVKDLLAQAKVQVDLDDMINEPLNKPLEENDEIIVKRVMYVDEEVDEVIPFEREERYTSLLRNERRRTLYTGQVGYSTSTFKVLYVDGVEQSRELLGVRTSKVPVTEVTLVGDNTAAISKLDFSDEFPLNENGVPTQYKEVLTNQAATGYYARPGAWGASGNFLSAGHVAVRAEQIPYNTKMYIASPDGSFVYGYAVASDTGTGLLANMIDVDLFYESFLESALNGRRNVNIYILE